MNEELLRNFHKLSPCFHIFKDKRTRKTSVISYIKDIFLYHKQTFFLFVLIVDCNYVIITICQLWIYLYYTLMGNLIISKAKCVFKCNLTTTYMNFYPNSGYDGVAEHILNGFTIIHLF